MTTRRQLFGLLTGAAALPLVAAEKPLRRPASTSWSQLRPSNAVVIGTIIHGRIVYDPRPKSQALDDLEAWVRDDLTDKLLGRGRYG